MRIPFKAIYKTERILAKQKVQFCEMFAKKGRQIFGFGALIYVSWMGIFQDLPRLRCRRGLNNTFAKVKSCQGAITNVREGMPPRD